MALKVENRLISEGIIKIIEGASKHDIQPADTPEITIKLTGQSIVNGESVNANLEGISKLNTVLLAIANNKRVTIEILSFSD